MSTKKKVTKKRAMKKATKKVTKKTVKKAVKKTSNTFLKSFDKVRSTSFTKKTKVKKVATPHFTEFTDHIDPLGAVRLIEISNFNPGKEWMHLQKDLKIFSDSCVGHNFADTPDECFLGIYDPKDGLNYIAYEEEVNGRLVLELI